MLRFQIIIAVTLTVLSAANPAASQGTEVAFGGLKGDTTLPVEVKSDQLAIDQASGEATFSGNVIVTQGEMRLGAATIRVEYGTEAGEVERLHATGRVLLVNATDAAEADSAVYTIATGEVVMTGNVLLTQGPAAMTAAKLVVNLKTGLGRLEGGVTTTFKPQGNE
jgi:lipopolysaccharide export system protein LptA